MARQSSTYETLTDRYFRRPSCLHGACFYSRNERGELSRRPNSKDAGPMAIVPCRQYAKNGASL